MRYEPRNTTRSGITNVETGLPEKFELSCYKHSFSKFWSPAPFSICLLIWHNLVSHYCESLLTSEGNFVHSPPDCLWNIFLLLNLSQNPSLLIRGRESAVTHFSLVFMLKRFYKTFLLLLSPVCPSPAVIELHIYYISCEIKLYYCQRKFSMLLTFSKMPTSNI